MNNFILSLNQNFRVRDVFLAQNQPQSMITAAYMLTLITSSEIKVLI